MRPDGRPSLERRLLAEIGERLRYKPIPRSLRIGRCDDHAFFLRRFLAHFDADEIATMPGHRTAAVTGFGPTNSPTLGTLSAMLAACELQRLSGLSTTVVVSDLGAWNSRNVPWRNIEDHSERMLAFLKRIGFDTNRGTLRTHQDEANLVVSGRIARFVTEQDFLANREVLDGLYQDLGIRGSQLGIMIDGLYTIADIVGPLTAGYDRVVMLAGIEEHYFTELTRLLLRRCDEHIPGELFPPGARVAALFFGIVPGLAGHEKMSKSIPASAVRLSEPHDAIYRKLAKAEASDDAIILRTMQLASTWSLDQLAEARSNFEARTASRGPWEQTKEQYAGHVIEFADMWNSL